MAPILLKYSRFGKAGWQVTEGVRHHSGSDVVLEKVTRKSVWWLFDRMIPAVAIVCFCIRFGNLMNSEIFGYPTTLPWGFEFVRSRSGISCMKVCLAILLRFMKCCIAWLPV